MENEKFYIALVHINVLMSGLQVHDYKDRIHRVFKSDSSYNVQKVSLQNSCV